MEIYLDTSLLIPLYVPEILTEKIISYINKDNANIYVSRLAEVEFNSAIALKQRIKELTSKQAESIIRSFGEDLDSLIYERIYFSDEMIQTAISFLNGNKTNLRALDALHLSCCFLTRASLLTADRELSKAAHFFKINCVSI